MAEAPGRPHLTGRIRAQIVGEVNRLRFVREGDANARAYGLVPGLRACSRMREVPDSATEARRYPANRGYLRVFPSANRSEPGPPTLVCAIRRQISWKTLPNGRHRR